MSGDISFPEFVSDFKHVVATDLDMLKREEREKAALASKGDGRGPANNENYNSMNEYEIRSGVKQSPELQWQTRVAILEAREKQQTRKLETTQRMLRHTENARNEISESVGAEVGGDDGGVPPDEVGDTGVAGAEETLDQPGGGGADKEDQREAADGLGGDEGSHAQLQEHDGCDC